MRFSLFSMMFLSHLVYSDVEVVSERDRFVSVTQKECEMREVYVENSLGNSLIGGLIGGLIGNQIGGGSGKEIATVLGAIAGTNLGRTHSENTGNLQIREICRDVVREIKRGKFVTLRVDGSLHTVVIDD